MQIHNAGPGERRAAHLVTQLSALAAATTVLISFIIIDAGASTNSPTALGTAQLGAGASAQYKASLSAQISSLALGGTTTLSVSVPTKFTNQLATKLTRIRRRHAPATTTTKPKLTTTPSSTNGSTTTTSTNGSTTTTFANGTTTTVSANGTTTTTYPNGTTTTTTPNGATTTTFANGTTTTTAAPKSTTTTIAPAPVTTTTESSGSAIPQGVPDSSEPSGQAPPGANAMTGYAQTYVDDFSGSLSGWSAYTGSPGAGSQWGGVSHAVVSGGMLSLEAFQDANYNNEWVTGGVSQNLTRTYGAYFVRSRVTGAGPTNVELLFPATGWPPEVDFNETSGVSTGTSATTIWAVDGSGNKSQYQFQLSIDMAQWHTWGVIWTPTSVTYTVDGRVWGTIANASEVPQVPMRLDLQQQTWCTDNFACPTAPESMQIDWVAEYGSN